MARLGIYEKALPKGLTWKERLALVKELGFDFLEFSIDESDERQARLEWTMAERQEIRDAIAETSTPIQTLMLSGHRKYSLGSSDPKIVERGLEMAYKAVQLAVDLGIRHIQLAGYDVFYEEHTSETEQRFITNLKKIVDYAASFDVMLDIETMDTSFINSIEKVARYKKIIKSPWLAAYPDLGNLSAWPENDVVKDFKDNLDIVAHVHLKDTLAVTDDFPGKFKNVEFGKGVVDFKALLQLLKDLEYDGAFTIEMWSEDRDRPIEEINEALDFFKPIFKEVGYQFGGLD
ncbi:MAG: L-ribulose-5-phosphate 3-epimerase [Lactobacillaceae bacterium]|jgi:predicted hexulose-6-phosphate isomerase|nr:L-ribulose-5-phosphate 3-epimerase [Lactobacillaceae bacterium]